jgi:hypothetical protein
MDQGPKVGPTPHSVVSTDLNLALSLQNLLEYLGLEWEMRSEILSQVCLAWDVIRPSEPEVRV